MPRLLLALLLFTLPLSAEAAAWPASATELPTTSAAIYLGNLDARIEALDQAVRAMPRPERQLALAAALNHRYRIRGALADARLALRTLDAAVAAAPSNADALQLRAGMLAGFHRFAAATADLDAAERAGAAPAALADARVEIALATGAYADVAARFDTADRPDGNLYELALRGNLLLLKGDLPGASLQFGRAQSRFDDSNPLPLAWLHAQQGIALLRSGQFADAAVFLRAAHARLPGYTLATEHLAEVETRLGNFRTARRLYARVIADTGNPEYIAALADLENAAGQRARAKKLDALAASAWPRWLQEYPEAFAQHAIGFYLDRGKPARALELARSNIALRRDVGSLILLAQAADAAGDPAQACAARQSALDSGLHPPELSELAALGKRCVGGLALR